MGLIRGAYASDPFTPIDGGPSWIHSAFYEINAKAEGNPSVATMGGAMMQLLLEEYFHLKIHHETTDGPVYFLRAARGSEVALVYRRKLYALFHVSTTPAQAGPGTLREP